MQDIKKENKVKDNDVVENKTEKNYSKDSEITTSKTVKTHIRDSEVIDSKDDKHESIKKESKSVKMHKDEHDVTFMDEASKGINNTIEVAGEAVKAINETVKSAAETVKAVNEVISAVTSHDNFDNIVDDASKGIHQTLDAANETVRAATEAVKQADQTIKVAGQAISDIYNTVEEPIGEAIDMIGNKINEALDPKNQKEFIKSPITKSVLITLSLSLLTWGLYSFFRPKKAE